jgi:hypothetical protein
MSTRILRRLANRFRRDHKAPRPAARTHPGVENLETRLAPAVFNVNSLADVLNPGPGTVTLRSAIQAADTNGQASNTIYLTLPGTYRITLPGTAQETDNAAGEFAITGTGNLSIVNASRGRVAIDGGGMNRVFDVNPAGENTTPFTVAFQGVTIQHGSAAPGDGADGSGGGIRAQGAANIVLNNVVLAHNYATADGGGIVLESPNNDSIGTLTVNASTIIDNHAGDAGGGIETDGTGLVTVNPGTVVTENTCVNQGAGIWLDAGGASLVVKGALISDNSALTMLGGGIGNAGAGNVTIVDSVIEDNFSGGTGGGFGDAANMGNLTVSHSLFLDNRAAGDGGGIQEGGPCTTIQYSTFDGNTSAGADGGGGLFVNQGVMGVPSNVTVANSVFRDNHGVNGGGIEDQATTLTLTNDTFDANHALGTNGGDGNNPGPGGNGGGLDIEGNATTVTVANSLFVNNSANNGPNGNGGGINQMVGTLTVTNSQFSGNYASNIGGGVAVQGGQATITATTFEHNRAGAGGGGLAATNTNVTLTDDTFVGNATAGSGGAIYLPNSAVVTSVNDTITGNTAAVEGGGVALCGTVSAPDTFQNTIIALNSAPTAPDIFVSGGVAITDNGGNLIGNLNGVSGFGAGTLTGNPKVGPLEYNGGPFVGAPGEQLGLLTEALLPGSPALGKGVTSGAPATDERGFSFGNTPSIGAYQPQYSPTATPNQIFVESLYETLLHRPADPGAAGWVSLLNRGVSPAAVIQGIENSAEYRTNEVKSLYRHYLQREADAAGLQLFVNFLQHGGTVQQVAQALISSQEYFVLHGGTNYTFVEALYEDVLDRRAGKYGLDVLSQTLAGSGSRAAAAGMVLSSQEYTSNLVESYYQEYLGRAIDPSGVNAFEPLLQRGVSEDVVLSLILGSQEAYAKRA